MMRTILFIHYDHKQHSLKYLVKQIPYAPEDSEIYFIDISTADKNKLGVTELKYLNNHHEDDKPYVWQNQPAHISSCHTPLQYMKRQLLHAMRQYHLASLKTLEQTVHIYNAAEKKWHRNIPEHCDIMQVPKRNLLIGRLKIANATHAICIYATNRATQIMCQTFCQIWQSERTALLETMSKNVIAMALTELELEKTTGDLFLG